MRQKGNYKKLNYKNNFNSRFNNVILFFQIWYSRLYISYQKANAKIVFQRVSENNLLEIA